MCLGFKPRTPRGDGWANGLSYGRLNEFSQTSYGQSYKLPRIINYDDSKVVLIRTFKGLDIVLLHRSSTSNETKGLRIVRDIY